MKTIMCNKASFPNKYVLLTQRAKILKIQNDCMIIPYIKFAYKWLHFAFKWEATYRNYGHIMWPLKTGWYILS